MSSALLELRQITVSFDGFLALRDLNLSLQPGELRAVIGPNGAGCIPATPPPWHA